MVKQLGLLVCMLFVLNGFGQIGGKHTYEFLNLVSSPRQAALGGKVLTNNDWDPSQALHNPAAIDSLMEDQLALNFVNYFADVAFGSVAYARSFGAKKHLIAGGITYLNAGKFKGYDAQGNRTSDFTGNEVALTVGYAYQVPKSNLKIGANGKFISSKLEQYTSVGGAVDVGLFYDIKSKNAVITLVAANIGGQFTAYENTKEQIPFHVDLAYSKKLEKLPLKWHIIFENLQQWDLSFSNPARSEFDLEGNEQVEQVSFFNNFMRHIVVGGELFYNRPLNIRFGYNFRRGEELKIEGNRVFAGITLGFGLKLNRFRVNYAYQKFSRAANVHVFGLNINLK